MKQGSMILNGCEKTILGRFIPLCALGLFICTTANTDGYRVPERPCKWFTEYVGYRVIENKYYINCLHRSGAITVRIYR